MTKHESICFGEEEVFIVFVAETGRLKSRKVAGENEIILKMLKALNSEGILWLTRVCQVA